MPLLTLRLAHTAIRGTKAFGLMALLGLFGLLAACGGQSGSASGSSLPTLSSISVTPAAPSLAAGLAEQLTAMGIYSDGSKLDVSKSVTWSSSNPLIATINTSGLASAVASGSTTLSATLSGMSGTITPDGHVGLAGVHRRHPGSAQCGQRQY